jgi:hypothetical protein
MWDMTDAIGRKANVPPAGLSDREAAAFKQTIESSFGQLSVLKPALDLSHTPPGRSTPPVPLGTHPAVWP